MIGNDNPLEGASSTDTATTADTSTEPSPDAETEPESPPEPTPDADPEPEPESDSEPDADSETDDSQPEQSTNDEPPEADSETTSESESDPDPEPDPDTDEATDEDADAEPAAANDTTGHLDVHVEAGHLVEFFDVADALLEEGVVKVSEDGFQLVKQDKANVALTDSSITVNAFEGYDADGLELGINIERAVDILSQFDDDVIHLSLTDTGRLNYSGPTLDFYQALISPDAIADPPELPAFENHIEIEIDKEFLTKGVKAADMVSDHLTFRTTETDVIIEAEGDKDDVSLTADDDQAEGNPGEETKVMLSLDYMKDLKTAMPADQLTMKVQSNQPVIINGETDTGSFMHMVAPRIQKD
jgi:proliferating cell nuclear antigen